MLPRIIYHLRIFRLKKEDEERDSRYQINWNDFTELIKLIQRHKIECNDLNEHGFSCLYPITLVLGQYFADDNVHGLVISMLQNPALY